MIHPDAPSAEYDAILAEAKKIHPDMLVRLEHGEWRFFMKTSLGDVKSLPERFRGTHAWELWETTDPKYGNEFEAYRAQNFLSGDYPLEYAAELANIRKQQKDRRAELTQKFLTDAGLAEFVDVTLPMDDPNRPLVNGLKREALLQMMTEFSEPMKEFEDRWHGSRC